jgi:nicotinate-nucleotide adenylyltransferase
MPGRSAPLTFGSIAARPPMAEPGQRIGLLGGSFNPAHDGHRRISLAALARLELDRIWWVVSPGNPLKSHGELQSLPERLAQARKVAHHPRIIVTSFEAALNSPYTAATLAFLVKRRPNVHFVWLMGADNLVQLRQWRQWEDIFYTVPVAVLDRPGWHMKAMASLPAIRFRRAQIPQTRAAALAGLKPPAWMFLTLPLSKLSSTAIRAQRRLASARMRK